jgi:hypothetical protein
MTDFNKENLENFKNNFVNQILLPEDGLMSNFRIYDCLNWIQVMHGLRMFNVPKIKELYEKNFSKYREWDVDQLSKIEHSPIKGWMTCREAVNKVKEYSKAQVNYKL